MRKLKIGYIVPGLTISGGVGVVFQHANRLHKRGHSVIVATLGDVGPVTWFPNQNVPIVSINNLAQDFDILVATHWETSYFLIQLKATHKCYFVQSDETRFHEEGSDKFYATLMSYLLNFHFLTEAKWIEKWLLDNFNKKAMLVPNGLDNSIFYQTDPIEMRGDKIRVLLEGSIDMPYKGMEEAFSVVNDLDVEVWCVSSFGKPKPDWKCHRFFEYVPMMQMREIYSSCDILLKLSKMEGFFGPPLEMMACGGVCVVGRVTGYDEYIVDGENALVVDASDILGATQAIQRLIDDKNLRDKLRSSGMKTATQWNWESSIDRLERYYHEIVEGMHGNFSKTHEATNQAILHLQKASFSIAISPHEKILRQIGQIKIFEKLLSKLYFILKKIERFSRK